MQAMKHIKSSAHDRPLFGIVLMLIFCVLAPLGDAVAKLLSTRIGLSDLIFVRFATQALILTPLVIWSSRSFRMAPDMLVLIALRTVLHMTGIAMMVIALRYLPLADTVAIVFVMPFLLLILGKYVLDEEVGPRRILACAVGFVGTLMVIQPSFNSFGWFALLPLGVAVVFSVFMLITRKIAKGTDPITLQATSGLIASALILPVLMTRPAEAGLMSPGSLEGTTLALLATIGLLGTIAHLVMTWSLRFAPAATLAPMQYLEIPIATIIGWAMFGDLPNNMAAVGICVTFGAGIYVVLRERATSKALQGARAPSHRAVQAAE